MKNMANKKKIAAIAGALAAAIGLSAIGSYAYFIETKRDSSVGKAGEVEIAPEEISINSARLYMSGNGYEIDTNTYYGHSDSAWYPAESTTPGETFPLFVHVEHYCNEDFNTSNTSELIFNQEDGSIKCDNCGKEWANRNDMYTYLIGSLDKTDGSPTKGKYANGRFYYAQPNYFRTTDGKVVYCADAGKRNPNGDAMEMTEKIDKKIQRILQMGYPNKTMKSNIFSDCSNLSDSELELATQYAIYITEGTFFNEDGSDFDDYDFSITEDYIEKYWIIYPYGVLKQTENESKAVAKSADFKKAIHKLLEYANDESIDTQEFEFNCSLLDIKIVDGGRLFGPYNIETNIDSDIQLSSNTEGVEFRDIDGNEITSIKGSNAFYAFVPTSVEAEIDITAEAQGISVVPSYYYGNGNMSIQKMIISSPVPAKITAHIGTVKELMPGDVIDVSWVVENTANKAVVTRNKVYVYWDNDGDELADKYSNAIENTYLYKQNVDSKEIAQQMWDFNVVDENLLPEAGEIHTFMFDSDNDGEEEEHVGYEFMLYGDWLDGAGEAAEIFRPGTTDVHYGQGNDGERNYNSLYDDTSYTTDTVSFKIGFSPYANIHTSGKNLRISVITEAIQWQNTVDEEFDTLDWSVIGRTDY